MRGKSMAPVWRRVLLCLVLLRLAFMQIGTSTCPPNPPVPAACVGDPAASCIDDNWQVCVDIPGSFGCPPTTELNVIPCDEMVATHPFCQKAVCDGNPFSPCIAVPDNDCESCGTGGKKCINGACVAPTGSQCVIQACTSSPCENGGTCVDLPPLSPTKDPRFQCDCPAAFMGDTCEAAFDACSSNPCTNGECIDLGIDGYTCDCGSSGFVGDACQINIDDCDPDPCLRGTCVDEVNDYTCDNPCPAGWDGVKCDIDLDDCLSAPCVRGVCKDEGPLSYSCNNPCPSGYTGRYCTNDIDDCDSNPCENGGECSDCGEGCFYCECLSGFEYSGYGSICQFNINDCIPNPCQNGGTCIDAINDYTCNCNVGYSSKNCEIRDDPCLGKACEHGSLRDCGVGCCECDCEAGWIGEDCNEDKQECLSNPCRRGVCQDEGTNAYSCDNPCPPGWEGTFCESNIDDCAPVNPCVRGACRDRGTLAWSCDNPCPSGWVGRYCTTNVNDCTSNPCQNGGLCSDCSETADCFECDCSSAPGWGGETCSIDIDDCENDPCVRGTCEDAFGGYSCDNPCPHGWTGQYCDVDVDDCASNPCQNGGTCTDKGRNKYSCECASGYEPGGVRERCNLDIDDCDVLPCENGGTCNDCGADCFKCVCVDGFGPSGRYNTCDTNIDECASNPCQNSGVCSDQVNGFVCNCGGTGHSGDFCEINVDDCTPSICQHGGVCTDGISTVTCDCSGTGYSGDRCQDNIDDCLSAPCNNGGVCTDGVNDVTCNCAGTGYEGSRCDDDVDDCQSAPCRNGGTCTDTGLNAYTCACPLGTTGPICAGDTNDCNSNPCVNGGTCTDCGITCFSCACVSGFAPSGVSGSCINDIDDCASNPCQNGGACTDCGVNCFSCVCASGYEPSGVSQTCNIDFDDCSSNPCDNGATCTDTGANAYDCDCADGFSGVTCSTDIDECASNPCVNGGVCRDKVNNFACDNCDSGWTGKRCHQDFDDCGSNPCNHGTCADTGTNSFFCDCEPGWSGALCSADIDDCASNPCQHSSVCYDAGPESFGCTCTSGYGPSGVGNVCDVDIDDCVSDPCRNGATCTDIGPDQFSCVCALGWTGTLCTTDVDDCLSAPCVNGGVCSDDGTNAYKCACLSGYVGDSCETDYDDCLSSPCANTQGCSDEGPDKFTCQPCQAGWEGPLCDQDINDCLSAPCENGGVCLDIGNQAFSCDCATGWQGATCEADFDDCVSDPCSNGGVCFDHGTNLFLCECDGTGFRGTICELPIDDCESAPCQNGAPCQDAGINDYDCSCADNVVSQCYRGKDCHIDIDECDSNPCQFGSTCVNHFDCDYSCICGGLGYSGKDCSIDIDDCASNPCINGALKCEDAGPNAYECFCALGWEGPKCQFDTDDCASDPCQNGATCTDTGLNSYTCDCGTLGFQGEDCHLDIDDCQSGPCANGLCSDTGPNSFACDCGTSGFKGALCAVDIDDCASDPCKHNTDCTDNGPNAYYCDCAATGWQGYSCELDINDCLSNPCEHGTCLDDDQFGKNEFFCDCGSTGWEGDLCEADIDDCASAPCLNGEPDRFVVCEDKGPNEFFCDCYESHYVGERCELDANECAFGEDPDYNMDVAIEVTYQTDDYGAESYFLYPLPLGSSLTPEEYYGVDEGYLNKQSKAHDDLMGSGAYGLTQAFTLDDRGDIQWVVAMGGFYQTTGGTCSLAVDAFLTDDDRWEYCGLHAIVLDDEDEDTSGGYNYFEDSGGFGQYKWAWGERESDGLVLGSFPPIKDNCWKASFSGLSGVDNGFFVATADGPGMSFMSVLPEMLHNSPDFTICVRDLADLDDSSRCANNPCEAGADSCVDLLNGFYCDCDVDHSGKRCENLINMCLSNPCLNGGTCTRDGHDAYTCDCSALNYFGSECQNLDTCTSSPCENGGTCNPLPGSLFTCSCPDGFTGLECEVITGECGGASDIPEVAGLSVAACSPVANPPQTTCNDDVVAQGTVLQAGVYPYAYSWWFYPASEAASFSNPVADGAPTANQVSTDLSFTATMAELLAAVNADSDHQYVLKFHCVDGSGATSSHDVEMLVLDPTGAFPADVPMYPFGVCVGDTALTRGDSEAVSITTDYALQFYHKTMSTTMHINTDGILSFNAPLTSFVKACVDQLLRGPVIAPFYSDVDTTTTLGRVVSYRDSNDDAALLTTATDDVNEYYFQGLTTDFTATYVLVVTWDAVGRSVAHADALNTFQVVIAADAERTFAIYNYPAGSVNWIVGDSDASAQVGFSFDTERYSVVASKTACQGDDDIEDYPDESNCGFPGRHIYRLDRFASVLAPPTDPTQLQDSTLASLSIENNQPYSWKTARCEGAQLTCTLEFDPDYDGSTFDFVATAAAADAKIIDENGDVVVSGVYDHPDAVDKVGRALATSVYTFTVTSGDGQSTTTYTVSVFVNRWVWLDTLALTGLNTPTNGGDVSVSYSPIVFNPTHYAYTTSVTSDYLDIRVAGSVTPWFTNPTITSESDETGFDSQVTANYAHDHKLDYLNDTEIVITVTEFAGFTQTYTLVVTMTPSHDISLLPNGQVGGFTVLSSTGTVTGSGSAYFLTVDTETDTLDVTTATNHEHAMLSINGATYTEQTDTQSVVDIPLGDTVVPIAVTAEDGYTTAQYSLTISRPATSDTTLSAITIDCDACDGGLDGFSSGVYTYTVNAEHWVTDVAFTTTQGHFDVVTGLPSATVVMNGVAVAHNVQTSPLALGIPDSSSTSHVYTFTVIAQDDTTQNYVVTVVQAAPPSAGPISLSAAEIDQTYPIGFEQNRYFYFTLNEDVDFLHMFARGNGGSYSAPAFQLSKNTGACTLVTCVDMAYDVRQPFQMEYYHETVMFAKAGTYVVRFSENSYMTTASGDVDYNVDFSIRVGDRAALPSASSPVSVTLGFGSVALFASDTGGNEYDSLGINVVQNTGTPGRQIYVTGVDVVDELGVNYDAMALLQELVFPPHSPSKNPVLGSNMYEKTLNQPDADTIALFLLFADPNAADTSASYDITAGDSTSVPVITHLSTIRMSPVGGTIFTLTGLGLDPTAGTPSGDVMVGGRAATNCAYNAARQIVCYAPRVVGGGNDVTVKINGVQSAPYYQTAKAYKPTVESIIPGDAAKPTNGGYLLTIKGRHFGDGSIAMPEVVMTDGATCTGVAIVDDTEITCMLSEVVGGEIGLHVELSYRISFLTKFIEFAGPTITDVTFVDTGLGNPTTFTVTGTNFGSAAADVNAWVGGIEMDAIDISGRTHFYMELVNQQVRSVIMIEVEGAVVSWQFLPECNDDCPPGWYNDTSGNEGCLECAAGSFNGLAGGEGVASCMECDEGYFSPVDGATECTICPAGFFSDATGATQCTECPAGSFCVKGATDSTKCPPGQFAQVAGQSECSPCEAGSFSAIGSVVCTPCPAGEFNNEDGATSCDECLAGQFAYNEGSTQCESCARGSFTDSDGQDVCSSCDAGSVSDSYGSITCEKCAVGEVATVKGLSVCERCPMGTFAAQEGSSECSDCLAGEFSSSAGADSCQKCPVGYSQPAEGQSECFACEPGTFADSIGSRNCTLCAAGSFSGATASACTPCDFGKFARSDGQAQCSSCGVGQFASETGLTACEDCLAGSFGDGVGLATCELCPVGHYAPFDGLSGCTACPLGQFQASQGQSECERCPAGSASNEAMATSCHSCTAGKFSSLDGMTECRACPAGASTNTLPGQTACTDCETGTYQPPGQTSTCDDCAAGTFMDVRGASECFPCFPGTFIATTGTATCEQCAPGSFQSAQGQTQCDPCPEGTYSDEYGLKQCTQCAAGTYVTGLGNTACVECDVGKLQSVRGTTYCDACTAGRYNAETGQTACTSCAAGSFQERGNSTACEECGINRVQPDEGQIRCIKCSEGSENLLEGANTCRSCLAGYYSANETNLQCTPCPVGEYQPSEGSSVCMTCDAGTFAAQKQRTECTSCPAGKYQNDTGSTVCLECGPGTVSPNEGATECKACASGRFNEASGQAECSRCGVGEHQPQEGQASCDACPAGEFSNELSDGTYCSKCPLGAYAPSEGAIACLPCQPGSSATFQGSTSCETCAVGTATALRGSQLCDPCERGEFADTRGRLECSRCAVGSFTNRTATLHCQQCMRGSYQPAEAQFVCPLCPIGMFAEDDGQAMCERCPAGTFAGVEGSIACTPCAAGTAQGRKGQPECLTCPAGSFAAEGATECEKCGFNEVSTKSGSATCKPCDDNAMPNDEHTRCICAVGFAGRRYENGTNSLNSVVCEECPRGVVCDSPGVQWDDMLTARGFWRADNTSDSRYYQCPYEHYCVGGAQLATNNAQCGQNRLGPLCAQCEPEHNLDFNGDCVPCAAEGVSFFVFIFVFSIAACVLMFQLWLLVRAAKPLTDAALLDDEVKRSERTGIYNEGWRDWNDDDQRHDGVLTVRGTPKVKPDFTYKLKIVIGFIQIITNISVGLDIQWPVVFTTFVEWFNFFNLDMARLSGAECVVDGVNYWYSLYFWGVFPPVVIALLLLLYLLPIFVLNPVWNRDEAESSDDPSHAGRRALNNRATGVRNFWRLAFFSLFLIYPTISSTVLRTFVCVEVEEVWYLRADFSIQCYDDAYAFPATFAAVCTLLYPIGIPLFCFLALYRKHRANLLNKASTRAKLGFLYDGYERQVWWFETVDMMGKLALSALIAFVPFEYQMIVALVTTGLYITVIEMLHPYIRKADNRLHMIALVEILLMLMAGNVFATLEEADEIMDAVLSVVLIGIVCGFFGWWIASTSKVVFRLLSQSRNPCVAKCLSACSRRKDRKSKRRDKDEDTFGTEAERQRARVDKHNADHLLYDGTFAMSRVDLRHDSRNKFNSIIEADGIVLKRNELYGVKSDDAKHGGVDGLEETAFIGVYKQANAETPESTPAPAPAPQQQKAVVQGNFDMDLDMDDEFE